MVAPRNDCPVEQESYPFRSGTSARYTIGKPARPNDTQGARFQNGQDQLVQPPRFGIVQHGYHRPLTWWLAWAMCGVALALLPPIVALAVANRNAPDIWTISEPQTIAGAIVYSVIGALLAARRPANMIGWIFLSTGVSIQISALAANWAVYGLVVNPGGAGAALALRVSLALAAAVLIPTFPLLLFPSGRFPDWWTRTVAVISALTTIALSLSLLTSTFVPPGFPELYERSPNPLDRGAPIIEPGLAIMTLLLSALAAIGLLLARYRAARGATRQQYTWVVLAMGFVVVANVADFLARAAGTQAYVVTSPILSLSNATIPVAMGVAILRYHLWDIDIIINRALAYLVLSACVVGIYVFIVGWLGTVFQTGGNLFFSLVATGVVAVGFQPLREHIQRGVNHLIYGERDEPYAVISRLGRRIEESLAPDAVLPAITTTVREALRLPYSAIEVQQGDGDARVILAATGVPVPDLVRFPLIYQHEPVGELVLAPRAHGESFSAADRRLLDDFARQAGVAVHAVQLTAALQLARERLVAAREEERRRLRRDLHDGLGSQLAALNLQAGALKGLIERDSAAAQAEVVELRFQLRAAITSIRALVHDLRPPAIDELGLLVAIQERVRRYRVDGLVIETQLPETLPTLPAAVEVAVYRIIEEALANVVTHARAQRCVVHLAVADSLALTIDDDGTGIDPRARAGVGLLSMRERAEEVGGLCVIEPRPDGGTCVGVTLPLGTGRVDGF